MRIIRVITITLFAVFIAFSLDAQVPVAVSKKKTEIDGKVFYLHIVKQGETLYSISKAYKILQKDIVINNPSAIDAIRVGEELYIPAKSGVSRFKGHPMESAQFIYHIAKEGQTVFSVAKQYGITEAELYKHNPELEHAPLQVGQVVNIPKKNPVTPKTHDGFTTHVVKRGETLFSIARMHDLNVNRILEANPGIDNRKLRLGQEIKIPLPEFAPIGIPVAIAETDTIVIRADTLNPDDDTDLDEELKGGDVNDGEAVDDDVNPDTVACEPAENREYVIAMLLPLSLDDKPAAADSSIKKDANGRYVKSDGTYWISPRSETALEFYEGALIAVDSLNKLGFKAQILVYDTSRDSLKMDAILAKPELKEADLIIGPFYTELVNRVARFASENHIFFVSPNATNIASVRHCPYLIQVNSGEINTIAPIASFIARNQAPYRVVIIGNKSENDQSLFQAYQNKFATMLPDSQIVALQFTTDAAIPPTKYLKQGIRNVVIVTAIDEGFISLLAAHLNAVARDYPIELFGLGVWTKYVNLDSEYLHTLDFRYATAYFVDYNQQNVQRFLQQCRSYYASEPPVAQHGNTILPVQYAFLGYDVMFYFCTALQHYGKTFGHCLTNFKLPLLQSDFRFSRVAPSSGFINNNLILYHYTRQYNIEREASEE